MKALIAVFVLLVAICLPVQSATVDTTSFTTQTLSPTDFRIARPDGWFYAEGHAPSSLSWIVSKESTANGQPYETGVRLQLFANVKEKTGKSPRDFILNFVAEKKQSVDRIVSSCEETPQGLFTRICLETEEGPYRITYSLFWASNDKDLAFVMVSGTKKELWTQYAPIFDRMGRVELVDPKAPPSSAANPLDTVAVYLVPLDDFPEQIASSLAQQLQRNLNLRVKASLRLPPLNLSTLPGTNQYVLEDILSLGAAASEALPEAAPDTYRIFLTTRDINMRSGNFRFQFSGHNKALNCSAISLARLLEYSGNTPSFTERAANRLLKMTKRAIGEMRFGWTRSADRSDLMYSPLMSLDDLDRLGVEHAGGGAGGGQPAVETYRMTNLTLLQPDAVLSQRIADAAALASYVKGINEAVSATLKGHQPATPSGGHIVVAVRPGAKSRVWLAMEPALPMPTAVKLIAAAQAVRPPAVKGGTVVFALNASLWGGASAGIQPTPPEWKRILDKAGHPLEASKLADLAWGK